MTITIKDIAKKANVSYSTVSKALNNSPLVKKETKETILSIAKDLNYQPNYVAKKLVTKSSHVIGLIWPTIDREVLSMLVTEINKKMSQTNYSIILSIDSIEKSIINFSKFQVDGIILFNEDKHAIPSHINIPIISYGLTNYHNIYPVIEVNHRKAIMIAVDYLYHQGHKNICFFGHINTRETFQVEKLNGFKNAVEKYNIESGSFFIDTNGLEWLNAYQSAKDILNQATKPTAIISGSYDISVGLIRYLKEANISVPNEMSIISYDNIPQFATTEIPLTATGVPIDQLASEIVQQTIYSIENKNIDSHSIVQLEPVLNLRNSTRKLSN